MKASKPQSLYVLPIEFQGMKYDTSFRKVDAQNLKPSSNRLKRLKRKQHAMKLGV